MFVFLEGNQPTKSHVEDPSIESKSDSSAELRLPSSGFSAMDAVFFAAAFVFIYTQLFQFPFTPYYFEGDHMIMTSNAMRLLGGEVIYRDFFHLTPPGAEIVYAALFSLFGINVWVLNFVILCLGLAHITAIWYFSRRIFSGFLVYLPAALFLILGYRLLFIDGTYRLFSVVLVYGAIAVLFGGRSARRLAAAGALCGLASFFMQPRGVMAIAGISFFLLWENYRNGFSFARLLKSGMQLAVPFVLVTIAAHSFFAWQAGFDNYYFSVVTFLFKYYPSDPLSNSTAFLSEIPDLRHYFQIYSPASAIFRFFRIATPVLFFYLLVPLVYLVYFVFRRLARTFDTDRPADTQLMLLCIVGITLSAGVSAPSVIRLSHVAIPAIVVLVWLLSRIPKFRIAAIPIFTSLVMIAGAYVIQRQTVKKTYLDMPAGTAAFLSDEVVPRYRWVGEHTRPGDLFYEPHHPSFYFPFHLKNPTPLYVVRDTNYSPDFQVNAVVRALENTPPKYIAWPRKWSKPASERLPGDNLAPLWQFVSTKYKFKLEFDKPLDYNIYGEGDIEIWEYAEDQNSPSAITANE